jgi:hypothetical protein
MHTVRHGLSIGNERTGSDFFLTLSSTFECSVLSDAGGGI